jgi:small multidrug resistance family-3 protein
MAYLVWLLFVAAAILEVGGDALIRKGLRGYGWTATAAGCAALALYGVAVNLVPRVWTAWDFSKLLGVYVAFFALVGVLWGLLIFREAVPVTTWLGLAFIVAGGLVIQFGPNVLR